MKLKNYKHKKVLASMMLISLALDMIPPNIYADNLITNTANTAKVDVVVSSKNANTTITQESADVDVAVDVNLVQRTLSILDVAKFVNTANTQNIKQDFKPDLKSSLLETLEEYTYADITEYAGFTNNLYEPITVDKEAKTDYASKLEWLIYNNLLNRTTYFMFNENETYSDMYRSPRPAVETEIDVEGNYSLKHKYYYPSYKVSKTDFITDMMKIDKVQCSRPFIVQVPYSRTDVNLNKALIQSEPIETSPYTRELGNTGLDYASQDIVADHTVFKQAEILATSDVTELYLISALNKNIISDEEIGGVEGTQLLKDKSSMENSINKSGYLKFNDPIRQMYDSTSFKLHSKKLEQDIIYPTEVQQDGNYATTNKNLPNVEESIDTGTIPPWGYSYHYNTKEFCIFANPTNKEPISIVKRPSIVEVNNKQYSYSPEVSSIKEDRGYEYFKKEEITVAEAYVLVYKLLLALGNESKLTETEVSYLNSKYSLNFSNFTSEERQATEYLIAKGIVDGADKNLYLASSTILTNNESIDLLYRTANKDARIAFNPTLTSIDKEMATRGYSQVTITKHNDTTGFEVVEDITKGKKLYTTGLDGSTVEVEREGVTYQEIQNVDRVKNPSTYDIIYVRIPKYVSNNISSGGYFKMLTNDDYRVTIDPMNMLLNYGKKDITIPTGLDTGEAVYGNDVNLSYIFKDKDGYYWTRFILHKSVSNKVVLQAYSNDFTYTFDGIKGEGVYYVEEEGNDLTYRKIPLTDAKNYALSKRLYTLIISSDLNVRNNLGTLSTTEVATNISSSQINNTIQIASSISTSTSTTTLLENGIIEETFTRSLPLTLNPTPPNLTTQSTSPSNLTTATTMSILLNVTKEEDLGTILFNGSELFKQDSAGKWYIDKDNIKATQVVKDSIIGFTKDSNSNKYYLQYRSPYQNSAESATYDLLGKLSKLGVNSLDTDNASSSPGYAKIDSNGKMIALICQDELEKYGIVVKGTTGRMLYNTQTGQRAFINSADCTTLIGNNITQYNKDDLMVTATGDGSSKKVYYNLAIITELINNTKVVLQTAGSEIFVAIGDVGETSMEGYRMIDIADVYKGASGSKVKVDSTYVASIDKFKHIYMDLSAIAGAGSNFFYYKNKEKQLNALIVYQPNVIMNNIVNYHESKGAYKSSGSLTSTVGASRIYSSANQTDGNDAKLLLLQSLVGISESKSARDLLKGNYIFTIYLLSKDTSTDALQKQFNSLIEVITNGDEGNLRTLQNNTVSISPAFAVNDFAKGSITVDTSRIAFKSLSAGTSFSSNYDFVCHKASGNLYALIANEKGSYHKNLTSVLGTRFYLNPSTDSRGNRTLYSITDYKTLSEKTDKDQSHDVIHMRYKVYYNETPYHYIPLEVFGTVSGRAGIGIKNGSGKIETNLSTKTPIKVVSAKDESKSQDSNVFLTIPTVTGGNDVALATLLELPYTTMTDDMLKEFFTDKIINDANRVYNKFYDYICADFDKVTGDYHIKDAVGNPDNGLGSSTGWSYLNSKISSSDINIEKKEQFFQGMWYGLVSDLQTQSYYNLTLPNDKTQYINKVLVLGNTTNETVTEEDTTFYIGDISDAGKAINLVAIKEFDDLPKEVKDCINDLQAGKQSTKQLRMYYKPSLAVPAGTTLLKVPDASHAPTELVLYPTENIRTYFYPAKDVINSLLMMAQEKDECTFLYQIPKGSRVILPNSNEGMIKLSEALEADKGGKLKWVKCATSPAANSQGNSVQYDKFNYISESALLSKFLMTHYNTPIPMASSVTGGTTRLGELLGAGGFRLPYTGEIQVLLSASSERYPAVYELFSKVHSLYGFDPKQYTAVDGVCSYSPLAYYYDQSSQNLYVDSDTNNASAVVLMVNMPPSLQVVQEDGLEDTWRITSYWDIENFNVSAEDEIVSYIRGRDTEIASVSEIFKALKSNSTNGYKYITKAREVALTSLYTSFLSFVCYGIPAIGVIIWIIISVVYIMISFPVIKDIFIRISKHAGNKDILKLISFGVFSIHKDTPELKSYLFGSLFLFTLLVIIWGKYITEIVLKIYN